MSDKDYDLICRTCLEMFREIGAALITKERVVGGQCWRCLVNDSPTNPVYRLSTQTAKEVEKQ